MLLFWTVGIVLIPQTALASTSPRKSPQVADVVEVSPPETIQKLRSEIDQYQPQVKILSPAADQLLKDDTVSVRFEVKDLPVFKDATLGLGPHIHVFLDNQPYQEVYDLSQPLIFKELTPGTHTIRAVASRPWFESFKNPGAYAQVTFHVFTQTEGNTPTANLPLLTYGQPQGQIGAETVLLDFYLSNVGSPDANSSSHTPENWQALVSTNGSSFYVDEWEPLYIKGLKPGKNWVRIQLTDRRGQPIDNAFNDTIRVIEVQDNNNDTLSRLIRGDLSAVDAGGIVDPNYKRPPSPVVKPPVPQPSATPIPAPKDTPITSPKTEKPKPNIVPAPILKQPDKVLTPAAPVSPTPSNPKSPDAPTKLPPTKPNNILPNSGDPSAQKSVKTPAQPKADEQPVPKAKNDIPSSSTQQPKPSRTKPTEKQTAQPTDTELSPVKPPASNGPVEKERKSSSTTSIPREQTPNKPSSLEDQPPIKTDKTATQPPAAKSTPTTKAIPQSSSGPVESKTGKQESAPAVTTKESTNKKSSGEETAITAPPKQDTLVGKDKNSSVKTTITNFWDKIRPAQETTTPSTATPKAVEKKETEAQAKSKTSQGASSVPDKIGPPKSTTPYPTSTKSSTPQSIKPQAPSTSTSKTPSTSTSTNRPPSSVSGPMTDKNQSKKGQEALIKENLETAKTQAKPPAVTSTQPETSVFSSLRNRWQQQKQKLSTPAPKESTDIKTPPSPAAKKTSEKTSVVKSSPSSNIRGKTSPTKTSTPRVTDKTSLPVQKTPSQNADKKEATKASTPSAAGKSEQTESVFSSLRDRWQQQKQIVAPPAKQQTTSTKAVAPKTTDKPSTAKPTPSRNLKKETAPTRTSTSKIMGNTSPTVQKTPSQNPDKKVAKASSSPIADQPKQTESVFSSLRDRWQQQKQLVTPSTKPPTKSTKTINSPTPNKTSVVKPAPNRSSKETTPTPKAAMDKPVVKAAPSKVVGDPEDTSERSTSSISNVKSAQPQPSVFSSLRDRWQQQKQIVAPPAKQQTKSNKPPLSKTIEKPTTTQQQPAKAAKTVPPKSTVQTTLPKSTSKQSEAKSSTSTNSGFSSLRDRWQQQKTQLSPTTQQQKTPAQPKSSIDKTPATEASPGKTDMNLEKKVTQSQPDRQESEPMTFDPGVFYRRLLSKDEASSPKTQPKMVSPMPSS